jgi:hypothetical protein
MPHISVGYPPNPSYRLRQRRPEWTPWLAVVEEIDEQIDDPAWDATIPARPGRIARA